MIEEEILRRYASAREAYNIVNEPRWTASPLDTTPVREFATRTGNLYANNTFGVINRDEISDILRTVNNLNEDISEYANESDHRPSVELTADRIVIHGPNRNSYARPVLNSKTMPATNIIISDEVDVDVKLTDDDKVTISLSPTTKHANNINIVLGVNTLESILKSFRKEKPLHPELNIRPPKLIIPVV